MFPKPRPRLLPNPQKTGQNSTLSGIKIPNGPHPGGPHPGGPQETRPSRTTETLSNAGGASASQKAAESSGAKTNPTIPAIPARELFSQTAAALGLPGDTLSVTLLAFCRFFSISPDPALLKILRRELLESGMPSSPETAGEKAALEAEALGTLAALDKGVSLSPEALEQYSRFFSPPVFAEPGGEGRGESPGGGTGGGASGGGTSGGGTGGGKERGKQSSRGGDEILNEKELRAIAEEQAKKDTLLDVLNTLPGKNGQYWTVYPLKINIRGIELKVFVRILKKEHGASVDDGQLIADIAGPKRQWRCFVEKAAGKFRADIRVYPALSPRALKTLQKDAERFLGEGAGIAGNFRGFGRILVQNSEEAPSWADALCAESLPSIDKKV